jgi:hypothetical protein
MTVNPFGKIHFCAVLGGNVIVDDPPEGGAAFKLIILINRTAERKFAINDLKNVILILQGREKNL